MLKRSVDLGLSAILLLLTAPVLALCGLLIVLESPGPVLFRQYRRGRNHSRFELLKLRSMRHTEPGTLYTLSADPRITRVGYYIRKLKIDELPQLWNVLRGEMSLVGPRPVLPDLTWEFPSEYERLLTVRPGLTDPASIRYCRETELLAASLNPMHTFKTIVTPDKLRISLDYMQRASLRSDLLLMLQTALCCVAPQMAGALSELPQKEATSDSRYYQPVGCQTPDDTLNAAQLTFGNTLTGLFAMNIGGD